MRAVRAWIVLGAAALVASCHDAGDAVLLVVVTASGSPASVTTLDVTLNGPAGPQTLPYSRDDRQPINFPTTLTAVIPARATGGITIEVRAVGPSGDTVADGREGPVTVHPGDRDTVFVALDCGGAPCTVDAGVSTGNDGGPSTGRPSCGNGRIDPRETCDTAISPRDPGACPPADCSDGVPCTKDIVSGDGCTVTCTHTEILQPAAGDFCCPKGATSDVDSDCSPKTMCGNGSVDAHETCDTAIPSGYPGACPTDADCQTGNPCLDDRLISGGTCSATCVHYPVAPRLDKADHCCPPGATKGVDADCPVVCGDGIQDMGESCDPGIPGSGDGACPTACPSSDPCKPRVLTGAGCQAACVTFPISLPISGDGCCPTGVTHTQDTDCPVACGNGILEPGEACDDGAANPLFPCPTTCPAPPSACLTVGLVGKSNDCTAHCVISEVTTCSLIKDGCCPAGCSAVTDADCSPGCDNGVLERTAYGELCDTAIPIGAGTCPKSCTSPNLCTEARLLSAGTCHATCVYLPITQPRAGDGCCPFHADASNDPDCQSFCGNGVVEPSVEHCDRNVTDSCPTACPAAPACTLTELRGDASSCSATCVATPISGCTGGDGCCAAGCTALTDSDCPAICGDGAVESTETCDRAITAGMSGSCPRTCDDGDACTIDVAAGSVEACTRTCAHVGVTACLGGDGCCPTGCTGATDSDCASTCGDGRVGAGETCDPPGTCPTTCPDDGDPCTRERLDGDPRTCTAICRHAPITACSGSTSDSCCPTGCTSASDTDC